MERCENGCMRPAEVEVKQDAAFSMTSTATKSTRVKKICIPCAEQDERMREVGQRATLTTLR